MMPVRSTFSVATSELEYDTPSPIAITLTIVPSATINGALYSLLEASGVEPSVVYVIFVALATVPIEIEPVVDVTVISGVASLVRVLPFSVTETNAMPASPDELFSML